MNIHLIASYILLTLYLTICVEYDNSSLVPYSINGSISFGMSIDLSGNQEILGKSYSFGVLTAFNEANKYEDGINGLQLELLLLDDQSTLSNIVNNVYQFVGNSSIFGIVGGYINYPQPVIDIITDEEIPYIGVPLGIMELRQPFNPYIINFRASYIDEIAAMINYLVLVHEVKHIVVMYSKDGYGQLCLNASVAALSSYNMYVYGSFQVTEDPQSDASNLISLENLPDAVFIVNNNSIYKATNLTYYSKLLFEAMGASDVFFMIPSIYTFSVFAKIMHNNLGTYGITNIISSQVIPLFADTSYTIVNNFHNALAHLESLPSNYSQFTALEGYLTGWLIKQTLQRMGTKYTMDDFLNAIYDPGYYDFNGFRCGAYFASDTETPCNQCMREIHLAYIDESLNIMPVNDTAPMTFDTCGFEAVVWPYLYFGQSIDNTHTNYTGNNIGLLLNAGIRASFKEINDNGGIRGLKLAIVLKDDQSNKNLVLTNSINFTSDSDIFALVGYPTTYETNIALTETDNYVPSKPMIGFNSGAPISRVPFKKNFINFQTSTLKELMTIVSYFYEKKQYSKISLAYTDDVYGNEVMNSLILALSSKRLVIYSKCTIPTTSYNNESIWYDFSSQIAALRSNTEAVIIGSSSYAIAAQFIVYTSKHLSSGIFYASTSIVGAHDFLERMLYYRIFIDTSTIGSNINNDILSYTLTNSDVTKLASYLGSLKFMFSHYVPLHEVLNPDILVIQKYINALKNLNKGLPHDFSILQGYLTGRLIISVIGRIYTDTMTDDDFINALYQSQLLDIDGIQCGPFYISTNSTSTDTSRSSNTTTNTTENGGCSNCLQDVYLYTINTTLSYQLSSSRNLSINSTSAYVYNKGTSIEYTTCEYIPNDNVNFELYSLRLIMVFLAIIGIVYSCIIILVLLFYRNYFLIKVSIKFSLITCVGCILKYMDILITWPIPTTPLCQLHDFVHTLSFTFIYGPLLSKTRRINLIFNNKKLRKIRITDRQVLMYFLAVFLGFLFFWIIWIIIAPEKVYESYLPNGKRYENCRSSNLTMYYIISIMELLFLLYGTLLCYRIQSISGKYSTFNEAKPIGVCIYSSCCFGILYFFVGFLVNDPNNLFLIRSIFQICDVTVVISTLFIAPIKFAYNDVGMEAINGPSSGGTTKPVTGTTAPRSRMKSVDSTNKKVAIDTSGAASGSDDLEST